MAVDVVIRKGEVYLEMDGYPGQKITTIEPRYGGTFNLEAEDGYKITGNVKVLIGMEDTWGNGWMEYDYTSSFLKTYSWGYQVDVGAGRMSDGMQLIIEADTESEGPAIETATLFWDSNFGKKYAADPSRDEIHKDDPIRVIPLPGYQINYVELEIRGPWGESTGLYSNEAVYNNGDGTYTIEFKSTLNYGNIDGQKYNVFVSCSEAPKDKFTVSQELLHCKTNLLDIEVEAGSPYNFIGSDHLIVTAEEGYSFTSPEDVSLYIAAVKWEPDEVEYPTDVLEFSLVDWTAAVGNVNLSATARHDEPLPDDKSMTLGFVNVYNPTVDELSEAGKQQYIGQTSYSQYIIKAFRIFCKPLQSDTKAEIKWGNYKTGVYSFEVKSQYIDFSCGAVVVPEVCNSAADYAPAVTVELWLPYIGSVSVNTEDVMKRNCQLGYRVNVLTGDCIATLTADGTFIGSWTGSMAEEIPVAANRIEVKNTNFGISAVSMGGKTPKFIVKRRRPLSDPPFSQLDDPAEFWSVLNLLEGYTECERVDMTGLRATGREKDEIERLLKAGVIIG